MRMVKIGSYDETIFTKEKIGGACLPEENTEQLNIPKDGAVQYGFTNDYMFRAVLQSNSSVLAEIVRILLHLPQGEQVECEILNPIILGEHIGDKECVLDVLVLINGKTKMNLEMQMTVAQIWVKRSMYYAFRMYTDLKAGQKYDECRPSVHVGFVKNSPFPGDTCFYQSYFFTERKTGRIFSSDFRMDMINLECLENAEQEDRESGLQHWVRLFTATDWKELTAMAQQNTAMKEAIETLAKLSEDDKIRLQCEARRLYEMDQQVTAKMVEKAKQQEKELEESRKENQALRNKNQELQSESEENKRKAEKLKRKLAILQASLGKERFQELLNVENDEEL